MPASDSRSTGETNDNVEATTSHPSVAEKKADVDMDVPGPPHESLEKKADVNMDVPGPSHESFLDSLPPWVSTNLRSPNSWKLLARCWLSSWAAFLLLIPQPSLNILGNTYVASFIFAITSV